MSKITLEGHIDITLELPIPERKIVNKPLYVSDENRYIDANAFIREKRKEFCKNCEHRKGMKNGKMQFVYEIGGVRCRACEIGDMIDAVDDFIAADVAPLVHAHWKNVKRVLSSEWGECSNCDRANEVTRYCPYCGAKMNEEEPNNEQ